MVDIITMLFTLVRNYFPAEIRWSPLQDVFDIFTFSMVMFTILYCMFFALRCGLWLPAELVHELCAIACTLLLGSLLAVLVHVCSCCCCTMGPVFAVPAAVSAGFWQLRWRPQHPGVSSSQVPGSPQPGAFFPPQTPHSCT